MRDAHAMVVCAVGIHSPVVVVLRFKSPARVESSTSLRGAKVLMGAAGGFTAELPKLRVLAATTQIRAWRLVDETGARCGPGDLTAAFEPRDRND